MKKASFLMLSFALSTCLSACGETSSSITTDSHSTSSSTAFDSNSSQSLSSSATSSSTELTSSASTSEADPLEGFNVTKVAGVEVKDGSVTLTKSQYDTLASSPKENCEYAVSDGVEVEISIEGNKLIFELTSSSGKKDRLVITLTVLSNRSDITIKTICGEQVVNGKVSLSESEYISLLDLKDYSSVCDYESSEGSTVQIDFDRETHSLVFTCLSQDETKSSKVKVEVDVALPFGTHSLTGTGGKNYVSYDYENLFYSLNGSAAVTNEKGQNLKDTYAFSAQIYPESLSQGSEVVFSALYANNYQIRFALRGIDETHYLIFSDYKDRSDFLNYKEHVSSSVYEKEKGINMGLIVVDGSVAMTIDGKAIYRRALPELNYTEMFLSTYECTANMKNLEIVSNEAVVKTMYQNALVDYKDKLTGVSLINTSENISQFVENSDGEIYVEGNDSDKRVMGALYQDGVPVGGYEYAISGHLKITDTKTNGGKASKVELQIAKNVKNFVKFHLFRYPTNNSIYAYPTENGKAGSQVICENKTLPTGTEYEADYIFVYNGKELKMYFKDGNYLTNYKLVYSQQANWGYTMFTLGMRQYCNVTFSNFKTYYGDDFDALANSLEDTSTLEEVKFSAEKDAFRDDGCFTSGNVGTYYKIESEYDKAFLFKDDNSVSGEYWLASGRMQFGEYEAWTQGELSAYVDATHAVRYVFEYTGSYYQVFHEIKNGDDNWTGYTLIVRPQVKNDATMNFTLVNYGGKVSLLINGYVYHTVEFDFLKNATATIGGKGGTLVLKDLMVNISKADVEAFTANMEEYTYVSPYDSRMNSLAKQYESAEKGGVLLMGSSTIDYWTDWQEDIGGRLGYNVGIAGTIVEDWLYAYDKLVKPFNPSIIVVFLGGNNINDMKHTGEYTRSLMEKLLYKMHEDFPEAKIHYIYSMAVPICYKGGKFNYEYGRFIDEMKDLVANTDWLNGIDTFEALTKDGEARKDLYRNDGLHLNDAGYDVFAEIINKNVFGEQN